MQWWNKEETGMRGDGMQTDGEMDTDARCLMFVLLCVAHGDRFI